MNDMTQEVVVFHSAYGLRPAVLEFADRLRAAGHRVHAPDLYDGEVFADREGAIRKIQEVGFDGVLQRAADAVKALPDALVYIGFSNGGACAELLAATRPGARAAVLVHAPLMIRDLGWTEWPARVPVQVHFARQDPLRNQGVIDRLAARVRSSGSTFAQFDYEAAGHLFTDPAMPAFDGDAASLMTDTVLQFLSEL